MNTLPIKLPDGSTVEVLPVPISRLPYFEGLLIRVHQQWIEDEWSTGETMARPEIWDLMGQILELLPLASEPKAHLGRNILDDLQHDYAQLETVFFGDTREAYQGDGLQFNISAFQGCKLWELHRIQPRKKLMQAHSLLIPKDEP